MALTSVPQHVSHISDICATECLTDTISDIYAISVTHTISDIYAISVTLRYVTHTYNSIYNIESMNDYIAIHI